MRKRLQPIPFRDSDPRSRVYSRTLTKPKRNWWAVAARCLIPAAAAAGLYAALTFAGARRGLVIGIMMSALALYLLADLKHAVITAVCFYQLLAPNGVRNRCRYEPSCSQYMILAVMKYGAFRGLAKGIGRLRRCNNRGDGLRGGFDAP